MHKKRFQECNLLTKVWRYRHILYVPFNFLYYSLISNFKTKETKIIDSEVIHTNEEYSLNGKELWKVLIGIAYCDMRYYYTNREIQKRIKERFKR